MVARDDMKSPGELLQEHRERRGLSLEEVAERTKIPLDALQAIELEEYHRLSGDLYIKSFLKTYAQALGLDPLDVVDRYNRRTGGGGGESGPGEQVWDEEVTVQRIGMGLGPRGWRIIGVLVLIAFVVLVALRLRQRSVADDGAVDESLLPAPAETVLATVGAETVTVALPDGGDGEGDEGEEPAPTVSEPDRADATAGANVGRAGTERGGTVVDAGAPAAETARRPTLAERLALLTADTLAGGWRPPPPRAAAPAGAEVAEAPGTGPGRAADLVGAAPGDTSLVFADGRRYPAVLRVISRRPLSIEVERDGGEARAAVWPSSPQPLPADGVQPGRAYRVREGFALYWGAGDHFYLRLGEENGIEVTVNGRPREVPARIVGRKWLLDVEGR